MPDLILLDLMIPDMDGFEVCKTLKSNPKTAEIPIIMLSAKSQGHTIVAGLELGADDYVTKPFSLSILIARIRVALRQKKQQSITVKDDIIEVGSLKISSKKHEVSYNGAKISLNSTEFKLLEFLASNVDWVFTEINYLMPLRGMMRL